MKKSGEFDLIDKIKSILFNSNRLGDDAAVIDISSTESLLVSTDSFYENVHFNRKWSTFFEAGVKAAAGAISDVYAMGGTCSSLFSAIAVPKNMNRKDVFDFYKGMKFVCDRHSTTIDGGDTVKSPTSLFSSTLTVIGCAKKKDVKLRSGAKSGDAVYITDHVGLSAAGLKLLERGTKSRKRVVVKALAKHLTPEPCKMGCLLAKESSVHSMIDISDGLSSELWHIAESSKVLIEICIDELISIPIIVELSEILGVSAAELVLGSGEEYALLFTASEKWKKRTDCYKIGKVVKGVTGVFLKNKEGMTLLPRTGYSHLA
jgi:thiamine-monophosphate kinase